MDWNAIAAIASIISTVAIVVTAIYVREELKALDKDRYLAVTSQMFAIWETREFMDGQLWLLHGLRETTWADFVRVHRGDRGEAAFHRVGSFYERLGTLVRLELVNRDEILPTIGAYAIAVWQKIQPLVQEARLQEHSTLFQDFERLLPSCYECYVPSLGGAGNVRPFEVATPTEAPRMPVSELKRRLGVAGAITILDVRAAAQVAAEPRAIPEAVLMPAAEVEARLGELPAGEDVVAYCA